MKQQLTHTDASFPSIKQTKHSLYTNYGGMLLGYIQEVVKEQAVAEQYLIKLFSELDATDMNSITASGVNPFIRLQQIARNKLSSFASTVEDLAGNGRVNAKSAAISNRFIDMMGQEQQLVFCGVHYYGKTIAKLAAELNKPEKVVRQLLRESFIIIRNNRNDTTIHQ